MSTVSDACSITTGKLDSNEFVEHGEYPFFTCAKEPLAIDHYAFDDSVILVAGNNAQGNFHVTRFTGKFNAYQRTYILTGKEGFDLDYVYYALKLSLKTLKDRAQGSQTKFLTMGLLQNLKFKARPLADQQKIAKALMALDAKIELNQRMNEELEGMAKLLYDYWFVQYDFPMSAAHAAALGKPHLTGHPYRASGGPMTYHETLKREIPKGWEVGAADALFDFNPTTKLKDGTVAGYFDMDAVPTRGFMTKKAQRKAFSGGTKFMNGDVVVARITPCLENGKTALITQLEEEEVGFGSTEFIVLRGKTRSLSAFGACLARSETFRKFAITNMTGTSGRKRIDAPVLKTYPMSIPPSELLVRFEEVCFSMFQQMTLNEQQTQELTTLRDWLLPMLMNGQVTVGGGT